jgi:hypothetical protein
VSLRRAFVRAGVGVALGAVLLAGCAGGEEISADAARVLDQDVDVITQSARAGDAARVQRALLQLRQHVEQYQAKDELSDERASRILAAGARVATSVRPATRATTTPTPRPEPKDDGKGDEKGGDDGKGDGKKDDD